MKFLYDYGQADRGLHHEDSVNPTQTLIKQLTCTYMWAKMRPSVIPLVPIKIWQSGLDESQPCATQPIIV